MRSTITALIIGILTSCGSTREQSDELLGMWVSIPNNVYTETGIIHFTEDSLISFAPNGIPFRGAYQYTNKNLYVPGITHFYFGGDFGVDINQQIKVKNDTLYWGEELSYIRTSHKSLLEHYVNSKGLRIELPESTVFNRVDSYYEFLDFFIGYREDGKIGIVINDESAEYFQTYERIKALQDSLEYKGLAFRVFADKKIEMAFIDDIHTTMERMNIKRVLYVTKNLGRNTYTDDFSGIESFRANIRLVEIKEDI